EIQSGRTAADDIDLHHSSSPSTLPERRSSSRRKGNSEGPRLYSNCIEAPISNPHNLEHPMKLLVRLIVASLTAAGLIFSFSLQTSIPQARAQTGRTKALVGGTLIDGYGGKPLRNSIVVIEGERIKAIGQVGMLPIPKDAEVISTEGMSVLPGLWDMHVHLQINGHSDYAHWD